MKKGEISEPGSPGVSVFFVAGSRGVAAGISGAGAGAAWAFGFSTAGAGGGSTMGLNATVGGGVGTGLGFSATGAGLGALTFSFSRSKPASADLRNWSISALPLPLPFPLPFPFPFDGLGATGVFGTADSTTTVLRSSSASAWYFASGGASWRTGAGILTFGISRLRRSRSAGRENLSSSDLGFSRLRGSAGAGSVLVSRTGCAGAAAKAGHASAGPASDLASGLASGFPRTAAMDARSSAILSGFSKYSAAP